MKTYSMPLGRTREHTPAHPERTATRRTDAGIFAEVVYREWPNRKSMALTIRMQERSPSSHLHWDACVPLSETEGYFR